MNRMSPTWLAPLLEQILEQMAFMFLTPPDDTGGVETPQAGWPTVELRFAGLRGGRLALTAEPSLARELAANALGIEPDEPLADDHAGDALGELLNILCGHVLTELFGPEAACALDPPVRLDPEGEADWNSALRVRVDGRAMLLILECEGD
jgi:hypothetical protein